MTAGDEKREKHKAEGTGEVDEKAAGRVQLVEDLVAQVPGFEDAYECHVFNEHGVLAHLFFWDVVQDTVRSYLNEGDADGPDWCQVLAFLEEKTRGREPGAIEVIVTSFLYDLPLRGGTRVRDRGASRAGHEGEIPAAAALVQGAAHGPRAHFRRGWVKRNRLPAGSRKPQSRTP